MDRTVAASKVVLLRGAVMSWATRAGRSPRVETEPGDPPTKPVSRPIGVGDRAPGFVLSSSSGTRQGLEEIVVSGPALMVFFKTTCKSSQIAIPVYGELQRRYGDVVPVVAIAQDPLDTAEAWLADRQFVGHVLTDFPDYEVSERYDLQGLPTAVLVDRDAVVLASLVGWNRDACNALASRIGRLAARDERAVSTPEDGRIPFRPG